MKRIEFGFFDAGGGHRAAATALEMAIRPATPWEVELTNLQELLDSLDILKKLTRIRIQDIYNTMLRNGWTLGSPQLIRVLQLVIRIYHRPTVRILEEYWRKTQPDMLVSFVPHFNRALCESFGHVFPGRPFVTILTDIADYPPHFWIERQLQYFICGSDRAVEQARSMGHPENRIFRASGMILHPRFYEPAMEDRSLRGKGWACAPICRRVWSFSADTARRRCWKSRSGSIAQTGASTDSGLRKKRKAREELRAGKSRVPVLVEGFTSNVNYYMQLADFFIGKPGPGSVSEALAMELPVIVECNAWTLPQERYNAEWIVEKRWAGAAQFSQNQKSGRGTDRTRRTGALPRQRRSPEQSRRLRNS